MALNDRKFLKDVVEKLHAIEKEVPKDETKRRVREIEYLLVYRSWELESMREEIKRAKWYEKSALNQKHELYKLLRENNIKVPDDESDSDSE